jgi:hypothetical protein
VGLAKLFKARVLTQKKPTFTLDSKPKFSQTPGSSSTQGFRNSNPSTQRLNEAKMKDRRERGVASIVMKNFIQVIDVVSFS